ncbi:MAG: dTMP kinase [Nitrospirae bacterium]|nr:MAG: dTMP kinase [Nitrospirota bacterium]
MSGKDKTYNGIFISFEGIDGCGKTTQSRALQEYFRSKGREAVLTLEPGGTLIGTRIREVLLQPEHKEMSPVTELLLYNAARAQHIAEKILPELKKGTVVITDRFTDSTTAYQGYGRGMDLSLINSINDIATNGIKPDLTILLDLDPEAGLGRNKSVNKVDRFELEALAFHQKVRKGFLEIAGMERERFELIDASLPVGEVSKKIAGMVNNRYGV